MITSVFHSVTVLWIIKFLLGGQKERAKTPEGLQNIKIDGFAPAAVVLSRKQFVFSLSSPHLS